MENLQIFRQKVKFLLYSLTHLLTYSLTHLLTYSLTHLLTYSLNHLITYSLTHLLTYSLTHLLTYSLTHLLNYSFIKINLLAAPGNIFILDMLTPYKPLNGTEDKNGQWKVGKGHFY